MKKEIEDPSFIGNSQTRDLHTEGCILAQSSSPENKRSFSSQVEGHRQGFQDCICLG